jgi:hypothetical protein
MTVTPEGTTNCTSLPVLEKVQVFSDPEPVHEKAWTGEAGTLTTAAALNRSTAIPTLVRERVQN